MSILQLLEREFVLHFKNGILSHRHFLALRIHFQKTLQFLYGLYGAALVELSVGRVKIIAVAAEKTGILGIFAFRVALIICAEIRSGIQIILVLIVAHGQHEKSLFRFFCTLEQSDYLSEHRCGLHIFPLFETTLGIFVFHIGIVAFKYALILAA